MTKGKKTVLKLMLVVALLCPTAYAEGDMGSGGKTCPEGQQTCLTGDMGSGGLTSYDGPTKQTRTTEGDMGSGGRSESYLEMVFKSIVSYIDWLR